ncbi:hypothetical protein EC957_003755 [Mortierella hygrophila]|uniref:Uncharacterized protein n=1 Tax=Mortierella hygrophila TaxID=979708 RepID=A0A9P6F302_9FUNG|nr:hypothetical protein EC957_003755 [Mortierella hygrophila]
MPEQTDKRRSWWGILTPTDKAPQSLSGAARLSQPDLFAGYMASQHHNSQDTDVKSRMLVHNQHDPDFMASTTTVTTTKSEHSGTGSHHGASNHIDGTQSLRRVPSKLDLFKKSTLSKRNKNKDKGASKFATITTAWSSSRSTLPGKTAVGSVSSTTMDLTHFEKAAGMEEQHQQQHDIMVFSISEQQDMVDGERERDVAYTIRAEGITKIILITRRISDFLDFDEKVRVQFPKSRPALPLLDDRRKSFLVSTRQFFFPRKNIAEKLEVYLRKVASHEPLRSSTVFQEFLAVSQEGDLVYSKEQPRNGFGGSVKGRGYESSQSDLDLTSGSDSDSSAAVGAYHIHHRQGNGVSRQEQNVPQQQQHHQQQHVEETVEVVRREPKMRGNRVRPGLPQIQERKKVSIDDFQLIKVLGRGCMGKVMLVREHKSKKLFALKAISKEWVILQREIEHTKSERNILANVARISHPFLIKLRHSFQSNAQLFMVLDYYPGGDIATQLAKWHRFEPERCLFYAAEIVLGIEELHRQGIVYRDLKPENILLAFDGHIVLTDFGLSKQFPTFASASSPDFTEDKTNTFCGTAEYLAPEILMAAEYSYAVDWWSLGTLLYEMLSGITPFWAENHSQMYQRVLEDDLEFPADVDQDAASFIAGLLERDPDHRLGSQGVQFVKEHPYFDPIDWDLALKRQLPCPYIPDLVSEEDLSNFDDAFLTMTPRLSPGNHTLSNSIQNCFQGYSYSDNKLGTTLPRTDSKIKLDHRVGGGVGTVGPGGSYIDGFDQEGPSPQTNGHGHGNGSYHHGANGNIFKGNNHYHHQPLHRSPLQQMDYDNMDTDDLTNPAEGDFEEADFYRGRPLTQLYAPPSAAISSSSSYIIETKAQPTSPALTPPTQYPEDGRMVVVADRISMSKMGAAADILRGVSERSSIDTQRHNSTNSSHSSGTIGRRLSRGYV